jgi:hypothetical protein
MLVGAKSNSAALITTLRKFASERGLDLSRPDINNWTQDIKESLAEGLISYVLEFYSVPLDTIGDHNPTVSDGGPGRGDSTNFAKRRRWMDSDNNVEGSISNWGTGSEKDAPAEDNDDADEDFGLAGLPGGVRDDPESPDSYDDRPQARLGSRK